MKLVVMVQLRESDGIVRLRAVSTDGTNTTECSAGMVGQTLADGKRILAGLQEHLVRALADEYCRPGRPCSLCGPRRPLKDVRARRCCLGSGRWTFERPAFCPATAR
jgi:hypothetical protein